MNTYEKISPAQTEVRPASSRSPLVAVEHWLGPFYTGGGGGGARYSFFYLTLPIYEAAYNGKQTAEIIPQVLP